MSRSNISIAVIIVVVIGVIAAAVLAYSFLKPTEEASAPIEAVPISESQPESGDSESTASDDESAASAEESASEEMAEEAGSSDEEQEIQPDEESAADSQEEAANAEPSSEDEAEAAVEAPADGEAILFQISQDESEARFNIDEDLRGERITVVGSTDQVAGEIRFDPADLSTAEVGTILVNARTIQTDNDNRNRAIGNRILETGGYEFISFTPTSITGLPDSVSEGEEVSFQITGDLTVKDVTKEVTFDAVVMFVSESRLEGLASTTVTQDDFGLTIPDVPLVANVSEEIVLEIDFVAAAG